jgi:hypothetical protein
MMTTSKTTLLYYNGIMWRTVLGTDGTRMVRAQRLADGALAAHPAKRT